MRAAVAVTVGAGFLLVATTPAAVAAPAPGRVQAAGAAVARHPLGNFSVNSHDGLIVTPGGLLIDHVQDLAEIPTAQVRPRLDADGVPRWAAGRCRAAAAAMRVVVDGRPVTATPRSSAARLRPGQAGLPTLHVECRIEAMAGATASIVFRDESVSGTVGWHEVTARGDRMTLTASNVPPASRSDRLTRYPADLLSAPLDQRGVDLRVRPGGPALSATGATGAGGGAASTGGDGTGAGAGPGVPAGARWAHPAARLPGGGAMRDDLHTLAGAYALNALPDDERRLFEGHLDRCADCAAEVGGLRAAAVRLGTAAAEPPPPALRAAVLGRIGEVRQLAPSPADGPARGERAGPGWRVRRSRWRLRLTAGLAAGVVAASLLVAFLQVGEANRTQQRLRQVEAANRAVAAVISAPDAQKVQDPVTGGGTATVMMSRSRGQMVVTTEGLGPLPASRAYALWMIGANGVRSGGLFRPDAAGRTPPVVSGGLDEVDRIGITVEPATGSPRPTTDPIVTLRLT
ncbi:anti-sigma factor [Actinomadura alba]|uniref:Regulator of SigK n=1 Tax=Actinomadura alba TaxID=406431 RepID=A0ABR7LW65_9ACTN|nr:anti-sigma factor [Actinomadura alba]MBC6468824.1 anti-sigma factor [Actinomadura alba]